MTMSLKTLVQKQDEGCLATASQHCLRSVKCRKMKIFQIKAYAKG